MGMKNRIYRIEFERIFVEMEGRVRTYMAVDEGGEDGRRPASRPKKA